MLTIKRTGSIADAIAAVRDVPARVIPYAASTALTRTAQIAQRSIVARMGTVFDKPTRYTLGATFVQPSTIKTLQARVAVKNQAGGSATKPEHYLLPQAEGGARNEKRFERALRYAGVLQGGERAILGAAAPRDASGNLAAAQYRGMLAEFKARPSTRVAKSARRGARAAPTRPPGYRPNYIVGAFRSQPGLRAIFFVEGGEAFPLLVLTRRAPVYRPRLDFAATAGDSARSHFPAEFARAAAAIGSRRA
jgi:hypothetical protein